MKELNLWELMLSAGTNQNCLPAYKQEHVQQMSLALSRMSFVPGQEISINVVEEGWHIRIFSCYDDTWEINLLVTKDGKADLSVGRTETAPLDGHR